MALSRQNVSFFVFAQCPGMHDTNIRYLKSSSKLFIGNAFLRRFSLIHCGRRGPDSGLSFTVY